LISAVGFVKHWILVEIKQKTVIGVKVRLITVIAVIRLTLQGQCGLAAQQLDSDVCCVLPFAKKRQWYGFLCCAGPKSAFSAVAGYNLVWNLTARATKANEMGLVGYVVQITND